MAAFVVSLIAGALILAGGLVVLHLYLIVASSGSVVGTNWFTSMLGLGLGPAIMALAILFYRTPVHPAVYGSLIIVLSLASWFTLLGALFAGLTLGVVGGILTVAWRPAVVPTAYYPTMTPYPTYRMCPQCGRTVVADARFCSYCGAPLG
jgi:zinc-ribbon domain/Family of unknown function (DUF6114)